MKHFRIEKKLRVLAFIGLVFCYGNMQAQDDLLEFLNELTTSKKAPLNRADDNITVIDLSQYSAVNRTTTLPIRNGLRVRFINGTLTRATSLDGPILELEAGSYVEIGDGATITTQQSSSNRETILMEGAELKLLSNGAIRGKKAYTSVLMTSTNDIFTMNGGTLYSTLVCQESGATITFNSGNLEWVEKTSGTYYKHFQSASDININAKPNNDIVFVELTGRSNVINLNSDWVPSFYVSAPSKQDGDVLIKCLRNTDGYLEDARRYTKWEGDAKYQIVKNTVANTVRILYDDLWDDIVNRWPWVPPVPNGPCGCVWTDPIPVEVPCEGKRVTKDVEFPDDDLYWALYGRPEGHEEEYDCEGEVDEGEHDVYVRPNAKVRWHWVRWRGCGCQGKHIWVYGTLRIYKVWYYYYWRFIHIMPGGKVEIEDLNGDCEETVFHVEGGEVDYISGDSKGGKYGWYCPGGTIYVRGGKISGGTAGGWTGKNGKVYHHDGTVHAGIHNYGLHYWYGGYCTGGGTYTIYNYKGGRFYYYGGYCSDNGKIWNEGDLYIDGGGSISCGDIYCVRGCHIYILKKLLFKLHFIIDEPNIILNEPIILGGDGYNLTQADCDNIEITLPSGYTWKFDPTAGGIIIYSTAGITGVSTDQPSVEDTFDATGRKVDDARRGVTIQRMSDGTVRKVNVK